MSRASTERWILFENAVWVEVVVTASDCLDGARILSVRKSREGHMANKYRLLVSVHDHLVLPMLTSRVKQIPGMAY